MDRFGVKSPLAIGFLFWSLVSAASGCVTAIWQLVALRLLLGVGEAVITPGRFRWIRFNIAEKQRGLATGLFFAGAKFGPAIGAPLAVYLLQGYGWRNMFVILGLGCMVWLIPWHFSARDDDRELESAAQKKSGTVAVPFSAVFATPAIYGIIIGTFAYNYFNYFCMTWLPAYFADQWNLSLTNSGWFTAFSFQVWRSSRSSPASSLIG